MNYIDRKTLLTTAREDLLNYLKWLCHLQFFLTRAMLSRHIARPPVAGDLKNNEKNKGPIVIRVAAV